MIRCGNCLTEFDSKGLCSGCPSCGNGNELFPVISPASQKVSMKDPKEVFYDLMHLDFLVDLFQEDYQDRIDLLQKTLKEYGMKLVVVKIDDLKE
jgi:predicted  nucleic acid-binding Zn-ribbon protein